MPERYESMDYRQEISQVDALESIQATSPDFTIDSMEPLNGGLGNKVFRVNGERIFRFPRHERADKTLQMEMHLLPVLEKQITLSIPRFEIAGIQKGSNRHFVGYKAISGVELEPEMMLAGGKPDPHLTEQIASFFCEMHSFNVSTAKDLGVPKRSLKARMMGQILDAREQMFPLLDQEFPSEASIIKEKTETAFEEYLSDSANFDYEPKLIHGDLEAEHIFFDPVKRDITGIIDFGGARLDDPDYDLWRPYHWYGREFIELLLQYYPHSNSERLFRKMEFFRTAQEGQRVVRAIMLHDIERASRALKRVRERLAP